MLTLSHSTHFQTTPDSKVHGANMGPTWVLSAPDGPHVGPMDLAVKDYLFQHVGPLWVPMQTTYVSGASWQMTC